MECVICLDAAATHGFICENGVHVCVCEPCGLLVLECPVCRCPVQRLVRCFMTANTLAESAKPSEIGVPTHVFKEYVETTQRKLSLLESLVNKTRERVADPPVGSFTSSWTLLAAPVVTTSPRPCLSAIDESLLRQAFERADPTDQSIKNLTIALKKLHQFKFTSPRNENDVRIWLERKNEVCVVRYKSTGVPQLSRKLRIQEVGETNVLLEDSTVSHWTCVFGPLISVSAE